MLTVQRNRPVGLGSKADIIDVRERAIDEAINVLRVDQFQAFLW